MLITDVINNDTIRIAFEKNSTSNILQLFFLLFFYPSDPYMQKWVVEGVKLNFDSVLLRLDEIEDLTRLRNYASARGEYTLKNNISGFYDNLVS